MILIEMILHNNQHKELVHDNQKRGDTNIIFQFI